LNGPYDELASVGGPYTGAKKSAKIWGYKQLGENRNIYDPTVVGD
jgi:hypothetical protein